MNSLNQAKNRRDYNLRDWLERLDKTDRLAILKPGTRLEFELPESRTVWTALRQPIFPRLTGTIYPSFQG